MFSEKLPLSSNLPIFQCLFLPFPFSQIKEPLCIDVVKEESDLLNNAAKDLVFRFPSVHLSSCYVALVLEFHQCSCDYLVSSTYQGTSIQTCLIRNLERCTSCGPICTHACMAEIYICIHVCASPVLYISPSSLIYMYVQRASYRTA